MNKKIFNILVTLAFLTVVWSGACRSRYSAVTYNVVGEERIPLETESSYYLTGFILKDEPGIDPMLRGKGIVMVSRQLGPDPNQEFLETGLITAMSEIEYRIYTKLPDQLKADSIDITGESICRIIGHFELDDNFRHYKCREGYLIIDSVKSNQFFAHWRGRFFNIRSDSLIFEGNLDVRQQ